MELREGKFQTSNFKIQGRGGEREGKEGGEG